MKNLIADAIQFKEGKLWILNQQALPLKEEWIESRSPDEMIEIIKTLKVRGAPLIGIAAALALAQYVEQATVLDDLDAVAQKLIAARPTAVNLSYCVNQQLKAYQESRDPLAIIHVAENLFEEDVKLCEQMAAYGAALIADGESILTHCNTGALVTAGKGTALGVIFKAHQEGKKVHVYVDETRPLLQGARLTAWELDRAGVPHTLICDNMAASLMKAGKIHRVMTGADRIAANGDTANKIGTYGVAALARFHDIPFHIVAPETTIDWDCKDGDAIVIEERHADEVRGFANTAWSPQASPVYNPAFDVTPAELITNFITNRGVHQQMEKL